MKNKITTRGLYLGSPEAEAEVRTGDDSLNISSFFEDFTNIFGGLTSGRFLISGRKGSGKSAFAVSRTQRNSIPDQIFSTIVHKDEFALEKILNHDDNADLNFEALFEWMILVRLVDMIIESEIGSSMQQIRALREFKEKNRGWVKIDQYAIAEIIKNQEVNFAPLKKEFAFFRRLFGSKSIKAPFYKMIGPLRETVADVLKMQIFQNADFMVIFDDLDVKFKLTRELDKQMLMDLIRISKKYNTDYLQKTKAQVVLLIRDDVVNKLEGVECDVAKTFSSYVHPIRWYDQREERLGGLNQPLRKFINKRLAAAFRKKGINYNQTDPWRSFVVDEINGKASFKYILDHTFYLPRDIITIFKDIGNMDMRLPLSESDIDSLLSQFSLAKKKELVDELSIQYTREEIEKIFKALSVINKTVDMPYRDVLATLREFGFDEEDLLALIEYSMLIPLKDNFFYFSYREKVPKYDFAEYCFRTPYILSRYFRVS